MTKKILILTILGLVALLGVREYQHAERVVSLEYEIEDIKADYYDDGFNACLKQF